MLTQQFMLMLPPRQVLINIVVLLDVSSVTTAIVGMVWWHEIICTGTWYESIWYSGMARCTRTAAWHRQFIAGADEVISDRRVLNDETSPCRRVRILRTAATSTLKNRKAKTLTKMWHFSYEYKVKQVLVHPSTRIRWRPRSLEPDRQAGLRRVVSQAKQRSCHRRHQPPTITFQRQPDQSVCPARPDPTWPDPARRTANITLPKQIIGSPFCACIALQQHCECNSSVVVW